MKCPYCSLQNSKVTDSRATDDGVKIRRRRECVGCGGRFTTYEVMEHPPLIVIKKNGFEQIFDPKKLLNGLLRACEKRPVSVERLQALVDEMELSYMTAQKKTVTSQQLGEQVLCKLRLVDEVAYVRFASVYRAFSDVESFLEELQQLKENRLCHEDSLPGETLPAGDSSISERPESDCPGPLLEDVL